MSKVGQRVSIVDKEAVEKDPHIEENALEIIRKNGFAGEITKIEDGIHFVGFQDELGWVTQGYKANEIEEVK